jgi:hypothetical protein
MNSGKAVKLGNPGRTPEGRVRWAIKFRQVNLAALREPDRHRVWATLFTWQGGTPGPGRPADDGVPEAQRALRECIEALANGLPDMVWVPELGWALWPPPRRQAGGRRSDLIRLEPQRATRVIPSAVVFALVHDLNTAGADRLRACALKVNGGSPSSSGREPPCGVIFLANRRQLFCSAQHAQAAAWERYEPTRKKRRP